MLNVLQRPLFQDERSGVIDPRRIRSILQDVIDRMTRVQVSVYGDPVHYEAYLAGVESPYPQGRFHLICEGWRNVLKPSKFGSPLVISFDYRNRSFCFDTKIIDIRGNSLCASLPTSLLYYPQRRVPRVREPLPLPITVEFINPWSGRERLVRTLEDVSYNGLSFRTLPQDRPPTPGTLIPRLGLYSFEECFYSTAVEAMHVTPFCNFQGESFCRVGVVFDRAKEHLPQDAPFLKEAECEEIADLSGIQKCLRDVISLNIQVQLQEEAQRRPPVTASLEAFETEEEPCLVLTVRQEGVSTSPFVMGEHVRVQYTSYGTQYLFHSSVCRVLLNKVILKQPTSITWMRRRKTLRCRLSGDKRVRIHFNSPLLDRKIVRQVLDLSENGLSISLDYKRTLLFTNMKIEQAQLDVGGRKYPLPKIRIESVKTFPSLRGRPHYRIGILFTSLPESTRRVIGATIEQEYRPCLARVTGRMIPDIWKLFYASGFIYPEKRASILNKEKEIRRTWERLNSPETPFFLNLAFFHEDKILGAGAILQAYEDTWILQHLTALKDPTVAVNKEVNLGIAEELMRNRRIHYLKIYFRSNNPWPNKNFRTFAEKHLPPHLYDLTLYSVYKKNTRPIPLSDNLPAGIQVGEVQKGDYEIIRNYFVRRGKILYSRSESLFGSNLDLPETSKLYRQRGLRRRRRIFVAKKGPKLLCFTAAEDASFGANLSGLLNTFRFYEVWGDQEILYQVLPFLINKALDFYRSLGYTEVTLMASKADDAHLIRWGFTRRHDYYCLTMHRESLLYYLHYIRKKYGRIECRILRRIK